MASKLDVRLRRLILVVPLLLVMLPFTQAAHAVTIAPSAYATGAIVHADAIRTAATRLVDAEVAFSSAAVAGGGLPKIAAPGLINEVGKLIHPDLDGKTSYARGSSVELGLAVAGEADNQVILMGKAEDSAPVSSPAVKALGPVMIKPLLYAEALHGSAIANAGECVLGEDAANGQGFAADVELVDTGAGLPDGRFEKPLISTKLPGPERAVASSVSRTRFVPQTNEAGKVLGSNVGLMSEVRETIAPVRLLTGTAAEINIEVLGEWVLRSVATGMGGGAWVHYGPADVSPETRVIRVTVGGNQVIGLTTQQISLIGPEGLSVTVPGVAEITIGEAARAIGGETKSPATALGNGTIASAAVDVVRVKLVPASGVADVRVGHMETHAQVPAGGIQCPLPVNKVASRPSVPVGEKFTTKITVTDPYNCELQNVRLTDDVTVTGAATFDVTQGDGTTFSGGGIAANALWLLGKIPIGGSSSRTPEFLATGGPGTIEDTAEASAQCSLMAVDGKTSVLVNLQGQGATTVDETGKPITNHVSVTVPGTSVKGVKKKLVATGLPDRTMLLAGMALLGLAFVARKKLLQDR